MAKREIKRWITINGVHVPIYEGSSVKEAVNNFIDKVSNTKTIEYPKKGFKNKDAHLDKDEKTKQDQIKKSEEQKKQLSEMSKDERRAELAKQDHKGNVENINKMISDAKNRQDIEKALKNLQEAKLAVKYDKTLNSEERTRLSKELNTAQDNWLKKQVEVDNASYAANSKKNDEELATSKFDKDIEKARSGDLSVRNDYIDRLNNINAKMASGRGNPKLMQEAKELREKVKAINDAYRESDKFKKEDADWKAFQKEQAAKREQNNNDNSDNREFKSVSTINDVKSAEADLNKTEKFDFVETKGDNAWDHGYYSNLGNGKWHPMNEDGTLDEEAESITTRKLAETLFEAGMKYKTFNEDQAAAMANKNISYKGSGAAVDKAKENVEPKRGTAAWLKWMGGDKNSQVYEGTVNKVNINDKPSKQLLVRLNDLAKGEEPIGKFWDGNAELNSIYEQLQKAKDFSFTQAHKNLFHTYYRYYNDGDLPGWAKGTFNEFSKGEYNKSWGYYTKLSEQGELEFERRINAAIVNEYLRYKKKNK